MLDRVKRLLGTLLVAGALGLPVLAAEFDPSDPTVRPIAPQGEQRIEPLDPTGEQQVQALNPEEAQRVSEGTKSPSGRSANAVAKVFISVLAAGVSLAAMAASLLFL
jgi:hypothetical protein